MTEDTRNPYLILGLDYGATADEARTAFARCVRRIRSMADPPFDREDLAWALHELEHPEQDPARSVRYYRVPANRAHLPSPRPGDLFFPGPVRLPRRTQPATQEVILGLADEAYREGVRELFGTAHRTARHDPYDTRNTQPAEG